MADIVKAELLDAFGNKFGEYTREFSFPTHYVNDEPVNNMMVIKNKHVAILPRGTSVIVNMHLKNGGTVKRNCRVSFSLQGQLNLTVYVEEKAVDKRRFYKIKIVQPCQVPKYERNGQVYRFLNPVESRILDINIGGIFLRPVDNQTFEVGDILHIHTILNSLKFEAKVSVMRRQEIEVKVENPEDTDEIGEIKTAFGYGCIFLRLTGEQEDNVAWFINQEQLKMRRKVLEKKEYMDEREYTV